MAFNTYHNPTGVTIGSVELTGVVSINYGVTQPEIIAAADGDTHASVARHGTQVTRGNIAFVDPQEAASALSQTGTLGATLTDVKGATNLTLEVLTCSMGGFTVTVARDSAATCAVPFVAESAPTVT